MLHGKRGRTPLLGPADGLIQLHGSSSVDVSRPARIVKRKALGGRVTAQRLPAPRREWAVSVDSAYPEHMHALRQLEAGFLGPGTVWWFDEWAQVTNMLPPSVSVLQAGAWSGSAGTYQGGAGTTPDGTRYLSSVTADLDQTVRIATGPTRIPVPHGVPVTVSAYMDAPANTAARLEVQEYDVEGAKIGTPHQRDLSAGTRAARAHVTFTPGARTATIEILTWRAVMVTLPAVTLTDKPMPWADGAGCDKAVFELPGYSVQKAVAHPNGRRASYTMTVHELG